MQKINVALVSDFCYPFLGGVEIHILNLAKQLLNKVNKVIVISHHYPGHVGVKQFHGIKFYYLKLPFYKNLNIIYGTFSLTFFQFKKIFQEEKINLVHGHSTMSMVSQQAIVTAGVLGIRVIKTEHSLFSVKEMFDIHTSKLIEIMQVLYNKVICVSRSTRNNYFIRNKIQPQKLIVIPNAAQIKNSQTFRQRRPYDPKDPIKIIFVGRLTYRRGVDLLIDVIDWFTEKKAFVKFIIIGEGVKMPVLKKFIQDKKLEHQVQLLGSVKNEEVIKIMQQCDIFINTPLTESFGIALIEAALEGLLCVSTQVGGIPQVLPSSLLITTKPLKNDFINGLNEAIDRVKKREKNQLSKQLDLVRNYNWQNVSNRVLDVYKDIFRNERPITRKQVMVKWIQKQRITGYFYLFLFIVLCLLNDVCDYFRDKSKRNSSSESQQTTTIQQLKQKQQKSD